MYMYIKLYIQIPCNVYNTKKLHVRMYMYICIIYVYTLYIYMHPDINNPQTIICTYMYIHVLASTLWGAVCHKINLETKSSPQLRLP